MTLTTSILTYPLGHSSITASLNAWCLLDFDTNEIAKSTTNFSWLKYYFAKHTTVAARMYQESIRNCPSCDNLDISSHSDVRATRSPAAHSTKSWTPLTSVCWPRRWWTLWCTDIAWRLDKADCSWYVQTRKPEIAVSKLSTNGELWLIFIYEAYVWELSMLMGRCPLRTFQLGFRQALTGNGTGRERQNPPFDLAMCRLLHFLRCRGFLLSQYRKVRWTGVRVCTLF
jgi:hypothetical protein